jgi:hypothetical protein
VADDDDAVMGAAEHPSNFQKVLGTIPRFLSSHLHVIWLLGLGVYLIVLPLCGVYVSPKSELIGGNYTNVTSDIGACIAAGGTVHLVKQQRKRMKVTDATHKIMADLYRSHTGETHPAAVTEIAGPQE